MRFNIFRLKDTDKVRLECVEDSGYVYTNFENSLSDAKHAIIVECDMRKLKLKEVDIEVDGQIYYVEDMK